MNTRCFLALFSLWLASLGSSLAQLSPAAQRANETYQTQVSQLEQRKAETIAQISAEHEKALDAATAQLRTAFDRLIKEAASRGRTDEVRALVLQLESTLGESASAPESDSETGECATTDTADVDDDVRSLRGKWVTPDGGEGRPRYELDFKSSRRAAITQRLRSTSGNHETTQELTVRNKGNQLELTAENVRYAPGYSVWYELEKPFNLKKLQVTRHSESPGSKSSQILELTKAK
jgi:hypothetical protein